MAIYYTFADEDDVQLPGAPIFSHSVAKEFRTVEQMFDEWAAKNPAVPRWGHVVSVNTRMLYHVRSGG